MASPTQRSPNAPTAGRIYPEIQNAIATRVAVIYNQAFDRKVLKTAFGFRPLIVKGFLDPMPYYAQCRGEWNGYRGEYQYPKLGGDHRALGDCTAGVENHPGDGAIGALTLPGAIARFPLPPRDRISARSFTPGAAPSEPRKRLY